MVAVVVEPGLADGPRGGIGRRPLDLLEIGRAEPRALVRVAPHDGLHRGMLAGGREGALDRGTVHPDRGDPRDAGRARPRYELTVGRLAVVEVAVGVDHRRGGSRGARLGGLHLREERGSSPGGRPGERAEARRVERGVLAAERGEKALGGGGDEGRSSTETTRRPSASE